MKFARRTFWITGVIFCCFSFALSQGNLSENKTAVSDEEKQFELGKVIEKVTARNDATQSYALYLPTTYSTSEKQAILYCFDPAGRGRIAVERFSTAAEKYGYIVVGSNNSQNGLDGAALTKILNVLWEDTHARLGIDERRAYAAGFSGGARVASFFADACAGCVTGVVGNGAGFSSSVKPSPKLPFVYFGAVGVDDYNYLEMRGLEKSLAENKIAHRVETFSGGYEWLPLEAAERALAWMKLQAMKSGALERDEKFIEEMFRFRVAEIESNLAANRVFESYLSQTAIVRDFNGLRDIEKFEKAVRQAENSKELKKAVQSENEQIARQQTVAAELRTLNEKLSNPEEKIIAKQEIRRLIGNLKKTADSTTDTFERRVSRRALNQAFAENFEAAVFQHKRQKRFEAAIAKLETAVEIYPNSTGAWYELARCLALDGQKKSAIKALEEAVRNNFQNAKLLETEEDLISIRQDEKFQSILSKLKAAK